MTIDIKPDDAEYHTASSGQKQTPFAPTQRVQFAIEGMTCASCAMRIEKGLKKLPIGQPGDGAGDGHL